VALKLKKKKEGGEKGEKGEPKLTDLLNELIGIEIDNRKLQDENQKKIAEMHDNIAKLVEEQREASEQITDGIGRLEGAIRNLGTLEAKAEEEPPAEEEKEEAPAEEEAEEAPAEEEEAEEAPEEEKEEVTGSKEADVLRRLRELREKGG